MDRLNREHQFWAPMGIRINFQNGLNVKFPALARAFHLKVTALNNGVVVVDCDVPATPLQEKIYRTLQTYNIPWLVEIWQEDGHRLLFWRTDLTGREVCLRFLSESLSDSIGWMAVADRFHSTYNCWMTIQMKREFIPLFAALRPRFRFIDETAFLPGNFDAVFPLCPSDDTAFGPVPYSRVTPLVYAQNVLAADNQLSVPALVEQPVTEDRPAGKYVCLLAGADEAWCEGAENWEEVASFLHENGFETVTLNETAPLLRNLSLLQGAQFAVGPISPLVWLAWAAKKEVVQMMGIDCERLAPVSEFRVTRYGNGSADDMASITPSEVINVIKTVPVFLEEYRHASGKR